MTRHFCTYFDSRYLAKGLTLYKSLSKHCINLKLWILCLDNYCYDFVSGLNLPNVSVLRLEAIEEWEKGLLTAKTNRSLIEYYFTLTPCLPYYLLENNTSIDLITYLDSDLYFYSSPEPIFEEMHLSSIGIVPHRWTVDRLHMLVFGIYNVSWLSFRKDINGLECLQWYKEKCLEWCYDYPEDGKLADQKYLDDWPERFQGVHVIQHIGANLASWNLENYLISKRSNNFYVNNVPLIFFHFHGLTFKGESTDPYNISIKEEHFQYNSSCVKLICLEYLKSVENTYKSFLTDLPKDILKIPLRGKNLPSNLNY